MKVTDLTTTSRAKYENFRELDTNFKIVYLLVRTKPVKYGVTFWYYRDMG